MSGPDAPPHPLHVAEEHNDAEEGKVARNTDEGAGHGEVVQQVPEAGNQDRKKVAVTIQHQPSKFPRNNFEFQGVWLALGSTSISPVSPLIVTRF